MKTKWIPVDSLVTGDHVRWEESVFGRYRRRGPNRPIGRRTIEGKVVNDSYGKRKQQHTFTIEVIHAEGTEAPEEGEKVLRKGRNLYSSYAGLERLLWEDESEREKAKDEKHARGDLAREARDARKAAELGI